MGAVGRILLIIVVIAVIGFGAAFFLLPNTASRTDTVTIERPAQTVRARLASTPAGATIAEGITVAEAASTNDNTVTAPVTFADGATGRIVYTVEESGENSLVRVRLEQDLGANPLARFTAIGGGPVSPLIEGAVASVATDLNALPNATFEGLEYVVEEVAARAFFYVQNCSSSDSESVTSIISQAQAGIPPVMRTNGLTQAGPLMAVEPRVVTGQYCFQVGYPYTGRQPRALLFGQTGQTPGGTVLRMHYTGAEETILADVYDRMDALLGAARLDDPATPEDDWTTYEVYYDDPTQAGGSRNRDIFYVVEGDISGLTAIAAPAAALTQPAAEPAAEPAAAPTATTETPEAPAEPEAAPATP